MEFQHLYLIVVIVAAIVLFSLEIFSIDAIALPDRWGSLTPG